MQVFVLVGICVGSAVVAALSVVVGCSMWDKAKNPSKRTNKNRVAPGGNGGRMSSVSRPDSDRHSVSSARSTGSRPGKDKTKKGRSVSEESAGGKKQKPKNNNKKGKKKNGKSGSGEASGPPAPQPLAPKPKTNQMSSSDLVARSNSPSNQSVDGASAAAIGKSAAVRRASRVGASRSRRNSAMGRRVSVQPSIGRSSSSASQVSMDGEAMLIGRKPSLMGAPNMAPPTNKVHARRTSAIQMVRNTHKVDSMDPELVASGPTPPVIAIAGGGALPVPATITAASAEAALASTVPVVATRGRRRSMAEVLANGVAVPVVNRQRVAPVAVGRNGVSTRSGPLPASVGSPGVAPLPAAAGAAGARAHRPRRGSCLAVPVQL